MFCSNCGKEIAEDSTFCSGCGKATSNGQPPAAPVQQVVYVDRAQNKGIAGAPDEVKVKKGVFLLYFFGAAMFVTFILVILVTKLEIFAELIEYSSLSLNGVNFTLQGALEHMYEEYEAILWFLLLLILSTVVIKGIMIWRICIKRDFSGNERKYITQCVIEGICWIAFVPILCAFLLAEFHSDFSLSIFAYIIDVFVAAYEVIFAVLFHKAAVCETDNLYREKHHKAIESWTCNFCGNENTNKDLFCQKCGKNYGESEEPDGKKGWICKSCNTVNDRKDLYCKFCGKYK